MSFLVPDDKTYEVHEADPDDERTFEVVMLEEPTEEEEEEGRTFEVYNTEPETPEKPKEPEQPVV